MSDLFVEQMINENSRFRAVKSHHQAKRRNLDQFVGIHKKPEVTHLPMETMNESTHVSDFGRQDTNGSPRPHRKHST